MKNRNIISILTALFFTSVLVTGIMSFYTIYNNALSDFHVFTGFVFLCIAAVHIYNNWTPLLKYLSKKGRPSIELLSGLAIFLIILALVYYQVPPASTLLDWGRALRKNDQIDKRVQYIFKTNAISEGEPLLVTFISDPAYIYRVALPDGGSSDLVPQLVIWLENPTGDYVKTLYLSKLAKNPKDSFPLWTSNTNEMEAFENQLKNQNIDGTTAATPLSSFLVETNIPKSYNGYVIKIEISNFFNIKQFYESNNAEFDPFFFESEVMNDYSIVYEYRISKNKEVKLLEGKNIVTRRESKVQLSQFDPSKALFLKGIMIESF